LKRGEIIVKFLGPITALAASAAVALLPSSSAFAQRPQPTPEQRIERLEKQIEQVQRQVFPKGRPASTAGFSDDPAATQTAVMALDQRLDALERQMTDMLRQGEENANRLRTIESGMTQLRSDQEQRIAALEARINAGPLAEPVAPDAQPTVNTPLPPRAKPSARPMPTSADATVPSADAGEAAAPTDPGEDAYSEGFHLWEAGQYDDSIRVLRAFTKAYPKHRRVSFANNLIGRALLDKGQPNEAAQALLSNYRNNPGGDRAPDSLFYLGQALMKLGQPGQACKAYSELDAVYGAKIRPDLKKLETDAKAQAQCS
jgi:TolA-binding protein